MRVSANGCVLFLLLHCLPLAAQTTPASESSPRGTAPPVRRTLLDIAQADDFRPLFQEREAVIQNLANLDRDIEELSERIRNLPSATTLEKGIMTAKRDLEKAMKASPQNPARIEIVQQYLDGAEKDLAALNTSGPKLEQSRLDRAAAARRLIDVENRIASLFDSAKDQNRFRSSVTYTFGVLVMIVIVGFYLIARQGAIATTIFSGEMGMQFVTLFLIVIAIILFGIMGTLEGKELAALLGGLSGYILGRTSQPRSGTSASDHKDSATA